MKGIALLSLAATLLAGCRGGSDAAPREEGVDPIALTRWSETTELFVEHPPLVAGRSSRFAVHLTRLADFRPVDRGGVVVTLRGRGGVAESFRAAEPGRPGIFGVDVTPSAAGSFALSIELESPGFADRHEVGPVDVAPDAAAVMRPSAGEEDAGAIRFLKEQQWTLEFATEIVKERSLRESLRVPGSVEPRAGGDAFVTSPIAGRLKAGGVLAAVGAEVRAGQVLALLIPRGDDGAGTAALESAVREAEVLLDLSVRDHERASNLVTAGAAPARRLEEAEARTRTARSRLDAARARLAQHEAIRLADLEPPAGALYRLRAPLSGIVAESNATGGAGVEEGERLFRIVALERLHVVAHVPEAEAARLARPDAAEVEGGDGGPTIRLDRLIGMLPVVDPISRTRSVIYEAPNEDRRLALGESVSVRLLGAPGSPMPSFPESAVVDDAGRPVVFVQVGGESFQRRPVRLGVREGGYVQATEGVSVGERVVTKGAYLIRLSSLSGQVPAHGHVH